jgi:hypothetical protein
MSTRRPSRRTGNCFSAISRSTVLTLTPSIRAASSLLKASTSGTRSKIVISAAIFILQLFMIRQSALAARVSRRHIRAPSVANLGCHQTIRPIVPCLAPIGGSDRLSKEILQTWNSGCERRIRTQPFPSSSHLFSNAWTPHEYGRFIRFRLLQIPRLFQPFVSIFRG